ncbi:hypothetical protein [Cryobacterium sp. W22_MBD10_FK3]|uniref:hypothetical protein n=1 Tax=Cryobacterium sp. W22_MBD10_FK3 TaxID=3240273 RepID=UPI003F933C17
MEKVTGILSLCNISVWVAAALGLRCAAVGRFGGVRAHGTQTLVLSGYTLEQ